MSVVQYIGARYVPKFYENPNGSNDWLSGVSYEPLTVVTYASNNYTSKKPVPATVGNPAANPEYWVSTGVYNAQVETIRQGLVTAQGDIDDLETALNADIANLNTLKQQYYNFKGRKVLFVGDSYAQGYSPDGSVTGWPARVVTLLGIPSNTVRASGGIGFYHNIDGVSFYNIADDVTDKDSYTDVVICGGRNDYDATYSQLIAAVKNVITHYKSIFTNAVIHVGMIAYSNETVVDIFKSYTSYLWGATETAAHYLYGVETALFNHTLLATDNVHPNGNGQQAIADAIATALINYSYQKNIQMPAPTVDQTVFNGGNFDVKRIGDRLEITWDEFASQDAWTGVSLSTGTVNLKVADQDVGIRWHSGKARVMCVVTLGYEQNETMKYVTVPAWLYFSQAGIYLMTKFVSPDGSTWASGTLKYIYFIPGKASLSIWD